MFIDGEVIMEPEDDERVDRQMAAICARYCLVRGKRRADLSEADWDEICRRVLAWQHTTELPEKYRDEHLRVGFELWAAPIAEEFGEDAVIDKIAELNERPDPESFVN